jgi:hypothetical protein
MTVSGDTRAGTNNFLVYSCGGGSETGPENVYYLPLSGITTVRARISNYQPAGVGNPDVFLLSRYDSAACVPGGYGDGSSGSWAEYTDAPAGGVYIVVDGWQGWAQQYTLQVTCSGEGVPTRTVRVVLPIILSSYDQ